MRLGPAIVCILAVAGCGAPTDPTPNRPVLMGGDYPGGPYGYVQSSVIANLGFIAKDSPIIQDYTPLPMKNVSLGELRANGTKLILIAGGGRWCYYCNVDVPALKKLQDDYRSRGMIMIDVLVEGGYGITATEDDINRWAAAKTLSGTIGIDPERQLDKYADVNAFPLYIVLRASNMKIEYMATGSVSQAPLGPVFDTLLAQ